ncbi:MULTISPECIES: dGTP triphosphohydrolase [Burkholderiaceae]|uniref:Deoxyguanosinetriphosphate triphosphohydrolase-like protein n=1 Tax=Caballeronia zhejiangensis TaxID=871203 RepID=A0A656QKQ9_9BURK|nr:MULTISPECIES: dNTP triphosphohydrolase [Burkholderiaceae]KAK43906.1 deoxyguanosinetriphosphate triphosphohydrolase [Caballeronia jiangsuensis]KDR28798.1 deoxyguanosinetriphosphate triphosphohydrolase [Caballeronia zhejiangensis]SAL57580.1 deoxyguanosinetriphosphate triphosphohydrolase-like protein [Caballeronia peredens]
MPDFYTSDDIRRQNGDQGVDPTREIGRTAFRKDYARLLHAPSFRRLQGKTQLFPGAESDFFRNRLTHSLEVAQIASGIAARLNHLPDARNFGDGIDLDLVEFASLAHDLGHPPFGHNGEAALDELMVAHGGFEGNAQTLRIVSATEQKLVSDSTGAPSNAFGLNLTMRALASVLKYDRLIPLERRDGSALVKGYYDSEKELVSNIKDAIAPGHVGEFKTIECSIMDLADDIAYSTYDLEDSLHAGFVTPYSLFDALANQSPIADAVLEKTNKALADSGYEPLDNSGQLTDCIEDVFKGLQPQNGVSTNTGVANKFRAGANAWLRDRQLASNSLARNQFTAERVGSLIDSVEVKINDAYPQLSKVILSREALLRIEVLKHLNFELVIRSSRLAVVEHRGKDVVRDLFVAFSDTEGRLLPDDWQQEYRDADTAAGKARVVCDFVAGMTDRYAAEMHDRLFGKGMSIFKPL